MLKSFSDFINCKGKSDTLKLMKNSCFSGGGGDEMVVFILDPWYLIIEKKIKIYMTWTFSTWSLWEGFFSLKPMNGLQCTYADWLKKMVDWVGTITQLKWFCICYHCFPGVIWSWSETLTPRFTMPLTAWLRS